MAVKKKAATKKAPAAKASTTKAAPKKKAPAAKAKAPAAKAPAAKAKAPAAKKTKTTAITSVMTKAQIVAAIAEQTELTKKDVNTVFESLAGLVERSMRPRACGEFTIPNVGVKMKRVKKPATKARKMISPFTKEEITVPAKPATNKVKLTPLKVLKDSVLK